MRTIKLYKPILMAYILFLLILNIKIYEILPSKYEKSQSKDNMDKIESFSEVLNMTQYKPLIIKNLIDTSNCYSTKNLQGKLVKNDLRKHPTCTTLDWIDVLNDCTFVFLNITNIKI